MEKYNMASEAFSAGRKHYFMDFKRASNDTLFIQITRSDEQPDGSYRRKHIIVFEEDLPLLIRGLSSLCHHAAHAENLPPKVEKEAVLRGMAAIPLDERPRERLLADGPGALADAELLGLVIGSGSTRENSVELSARLLAAFGGLEGLAAADCNRLQLFEGIGEAKSAQLSAVMELARRFSK